MKKFLLLLLGCLMAHFVDAFQPQILISFGDSLSDNGNKYAVYHIPVSPPYWHGRFSNGPVWNEYLAYAWHLIPNPKQNPNYPRNQKFWDYAFGDGVVLKSDIRPNRPTRSLMEEVAKLRKEHATLNQDMLITYWIGANDFWAKPCQANMPLCMKKMLAKQFLAFNTLIKMGAKHFWVLSLPNLDITPANNINLKPEQRAQVGKLVVIYNQKLQQLLAELKQDYPDVDFRYVAIGDVLTKLVPKFKKPLNVPCYPNRDIYNRQVAKVCSATLQPKYLFWDYVHPTTTADRDLTQLLLS